MKARFYFNALGILGWGVNKLLKRKEISEAQIKTFDFLVPVAKIMDKITFNQIGLSVIIVCQKK